MSEFFLPYRYEKYLKKQLRERKRKTDESITTYISIKSSLCRKINIDMTQTEIIEEIESGLTQAYRQALTMFDYT